MFRGLILRGETSEKADESVEKMASTSGEYVGNQSSILSLQPWVFRKEVDKMKGEFSGRGDDGLAYGHQDGFSPRSMRFDSPRGGQSSVRSRRARRPVVTSVANCLIPQLYDQHFEIDEYVFSSPSSQAALSGRPFVVTDGDRVISKSNFAPSAKQIKSGLYEEAYGDALGAVGAAVGFTPLPVRSVRTPKRKSRDDRHEGSDTSSSRRCNPLHSQGSPDRMLLFSLGISIGVISTILSNRREVEKLNNLLKHSENLVQDLQDELDMKESLTVKELVNEACENQQVADSYADVKEASDSSQNRDSSQNQDPVSYLHDQENEQYDQPYVPEAVKTTDSMSKIEAELEAELERLELNMSSSGLEGKLSVLDEFDSDLIGAVVQGELREDMFNSGVQESQADLDRDDSSTFTADTQNPNYAVSPRELSLRLHELMQHRLEERIEDLERELQQSQKQLRYVEPERVLSQWTFSSSDVESTTQASPVVVEQDYTLAQPLCLNLSGEALTAYEETYGELMRMHDTEETLPQTTDVKKKPHEDGFFSDNRSLIWGMEGDDLSRPLTDVDYIEGELTWNQILSSGKGCVDEDFSGGDEYEIDDDEGKMIQQIVELTRQGSPVVLNAKKMLFSLDM